MPKQDWQLGVRLSLPAEQIQRLCYSCSYLLSLLRVSEVFNVHDNVLQLFLPVLFDGQRAFTGLLRVSTANYLAVRVDKVMIEMSLLVAHRRLYLILIRCKLQEGGMGDTDPCLLWTAFTWQIMLKFRHLFYRHRLTTRIR